MAYKTGVVVLVDPAEITTGINSRWDEVKLNKDRVEAMARSFAEVGQLQPCQLRRDGEALFMVAGFHRHAGMVRHNELFPDAPKRLKCIVADCNAEEALQRSITENRQRNQTTPMDDAFAQRRLREEYGWEDQRIAAFYAMDHSYVSQLKKLLSLDKPTQKRVHSRELSLGAALGLAGLPVEDRQEVLAAAEAVPSANGEANGTVTDAITPATGTLSQRVKTGVRNKKIAKGGKSSRTLSEVRQFFMDLAQNGKGETSDLGKYLVKFCLGEITEETMRKNLSRLVQS